VNQRGLYVTDYVGTSCSSPGVAGIQPFNATTPCPAHRSVKDQWGAPTGTVGVEWTPTSETNVYVRYNRGYKSGGFNLGPLATPGAFQIGNALEVGPEFIDDFEGGWKQNFGSRIRFAIAGFYYLYHDLQALNETTQNSSPPIQINELINIPKSHAYGVEFEGQWSPIDNLVLAVNYSWLKTGNDTACQVKGTPPSAASGLDPNNALNWTGLQEFGCYVDAANPNAVDTVNGIQLTGVNPTGPFFPGTPHSQPQSLKGNPLPYSPEHKVSFNGSYTFKFDPGDLTLSAVFNWHAQFYDNLFTTQQWLVPSGDTTDFRVTWSASNKRYQVIGTVTNAFNNNVWISHTTLPPGNGYYAFNGLAPPRIFSVELRYHF
jgi:iron complex outermembrane receptor protein